MEKVDIVIVCSNGRNRSRFLKQHLYEKGFPSYAVGVSGRSEATLRRLRNAKVIISVHPDIKEQLCEMHDLEGKKLITLDVEELTISSQKGKKMRGEDWLDYQRNTMRPELQRQINKHLPTLEKLLKKTTA